MMSEPFIYFGKRVTAICDENCKKAWGINSRPTKKLSKEPDDFCYLSDDELGVAPVDPGTYEGNDGKPVLNSERLNKWCVRECERCSIAEDGKPFALKDFSKRVYNIERDKRE